MKQVHLNISGIDLDYRSASVIAQSIAGLSEKEPTVIAWNDVRRHRMSPVIEGADERRWREYGESHGGDVSVSVNGDFDFIFADAGSFEKLGSSPYVSVHDKQGHEYLCLAPALRDPANPKEGACFPIDETDSPSALHEG